MLQKQQDLEQQESTVEPPWIQKLDDINEFKKWLESIRRDSRIRIMVSGKTGAGKSTALNFVFGTNFEKGHGLKPCTINVSRDTATKNGIDLELFDCPGLQDGTENEKQYLSEIANKCTNLDLVIFCISMMYPRADLKNEVSALSKITRAFGAEIWEHTVICLTFGNMIVGRIEDTQPELTIPQMKKEFEKRVKEWHEQIETALRADKIPEDVIRKNICVAGHKKEPSLPGIHNWVSIVWAHCVNAMRERAKPLAIQMDIDNLVDENDEEIEEYKKEKVVDPGKRKIYLSKKAKSILGVTGTTTVVTGVTAGAMIGIFAIGAPIFGPAAGVGLLLGGAVGASVGAGIAIAYLLWKKKRRK